MDQGAVTKDNTSDVDAVIGILNEVVATEIVCWLRYTQHAIVASGIDGRRSPPGSPSMPPRNASIGSARPSG